MNVGHNDPCPCDSGKQYEKCGADPAVGATIKAAWGRDEVHDAA